MTLAAAYLDDVRTQFRKMKKLAEDAMAQVTEEELSIRLDPEANSIALITRHMAGNLRSRFTDFLTTDGEKPNRDRDSEFEENGPIPKEQALANWESGWQVLFRALEGLTPDDLQRDVCIRGERHSVIQALNRQLTHHSYHVGQIVLLAKHFRSAEWRTLSIPRRRQ